MATGVGAIGIDFGSSTSIIAVAKKGGVEIITNEGSHRETVNIVGFGQNERFIGEAGIVQYKSNFKNTIRYFNRFLGLKPDAPFINEEKKWLTNECSIDANNKFTFDINYMGEKRQLLPEQVTGAMLQKLKQLVQRSGISNTDFVLSVPNYYTEHERKALLDAAKIAEINVVRLFNESSAIALSYGIFRKAQLSEESKNVIFIDFGHSKLNCFVGAFTKSKMKILCEAHERNLGVRDFDWTLFEHYSNKFNAKNGCNPMKNQKAKIRLLDAIERQRKILSANSEAPIIIESFMEDLDLNYNLNREEFEALIQNQMTRFKNVLQELKDQIVKKNINVTDVEIVGGGTRIPIVKKFIEDVFQLPLLTTLNQTECVARGCAMMSAIISPQFMVTEYGIEEFNYYPIKCSWIFVDKNKQPGSMEIEQDMKQQAEKQKATLFDHGCSIPNLKSLTFQRNDKIQFSLYYDPAPLGVDELLGYYVIDPMDTKYPDYNVKLRVKLNQNGTVALQDATLTEDYFEEVEVPVKEEKKPEQQQKANEKMQDEQAANNQQQQQPAEGVNNNQDQKMNEEQQPQKAEEQKKEIKKKKKSNQYDLKINHSPLNCLNEKQFQILFEEEARMVNQDKLIHETYEKKNDLESYIYDMRGKLSDQYAKYSTPDVITAFLQQLENYEDWLYAEGKNASRGQYVNKLDELKKIGNPIVQRAREYEALPGAIDELFANINGYQGLATSTDEKYSHITDEDKLPLVNEINSAREWINNSQKLQQAVPFHQDPVITVNEIRKRTQELINKGNSIMGKPKPQPKPEEKKAEENTQQQQQQQQQNDQNSQQQQQEQQNDQQNQQNQQQNNQQMEIEDQNKAQ